MVFIIIRLHVQSAIGGFYIKDAGPLTGYVYLRCKISGCVNFCFL